MKNVSITSTAADVREAMDAAITECAKRLLDIDKIAKADMAAARTTMRVKMKTLKRLLAVVEVDATGGHAAVEKAAAEEVQGDLE